MIAQKLKPGAGDHERPCALHVLSHQTAPLISKPKPPLPSGSNKSNDADQLQLRRRGERAMRRQKLAVEIVDQDRGRRLQAKASPAGASGSHRARRPVCRSIFSRQLPDLRAWASNRTSLDGRWGCAARAAALHGAAKV